jgi:hypothetical protein
MKRKGTKLSLNRETVRSLSAPALGAAVGGARGTLPYCSDYVTCAYTPCFCTADCTLNTCATCNSHCPTCVGC